jgi:hypothetical protein
MDEFTNGWFCAAPELAEGERRRLRQAQAAGLIFIIAVPFQEAEFACLSVL